MTADDEVRFAELWKWGHAYLANYSTIKHSEQRNLEQVGLEDDQKHDMEDGDSDFIGDFTVMVSAIIPVPESQRNSIKAFGFLRVWDGTGPSKSDRYVFQQHGCPDIMINLIASHSYVTALSACNVRFPLGTRDALHDDPPSEALVAISKIRDVQAGPKHKPWTAPERLCGRIVNVVIWEESHWEMITQHSLLSVGGFIRLRNVRESFFKEIGLRCKWQKDKGLCFE